MAKCKTLICDPLYRDIYDLAVSVCKEWNLPLPDHEEILSWKLPIMTIAMNAKVHRYDATLALIKVISGRYSPVVVDVRESLYHVKVGGPGYKVQNLTQQNNSVFYE